MSVTLNREGLKTNDVICQKYNRTTAETDVIVPDINPDILKVLDVSGYIAVTEKTVRSGKVFIRGSVNMTVLYAPDGEVFSNVKALTAVQEFNHSTDAADIVGDEALSVELEAESFNYTLINGRKINLRCCIGINIKLTRQKETELAFGAESDSNICVNTKKIRICRTSFCTDSRITLCEQFEIPSDKPSVYEILKTTVVPESTEFTLFDGKAVAKGQIKICMLYTSVDDGSVRCFEHSLPFSEVLDAEGAEEDMEGEIEYSLSDIYAEIRDDSDGEARIIGIDIGIAAAIRGMDISEHTLICDAYALDRDITLTSQLLKIEQLADNTTTQLTHKSTVSMPDALPEIAQICDVSSSASVEGINVSNGETIISGSIKNNILYITRDDSIPLCSHSEVSEFTHTLPAAEIPENSFYDAKIFVEHISYTMNGPGGIDIRIILGLSLRSFVTDEISFVSDIDELNEASSEKRPGIVICFAQKGDTLWNIAKRYHITVDELKSYNNLTGDIPIVGQQIRICR